VRIAENVAYDRRVSVEDGEMRHGRKTKSKRFNGYKRHAATDMRSDAILACAVTPANHPEYEALAPLKKDFPDIKCLLIGDGPQRSDLQFLASALGLADKVIFTGLRHDISGLYSAMDIFIQPSLVKEGLPLSLLEAASSGLPLIATNIGGNPEAVKDGLNGFIVPSGDAGAIQDKIRLFLERPDMAGWMGENSRDIWRERFRLEDMLKKVEVVYSERKHDQG
jgi:glycosyltransferase involved in cell wall biosynthesis